MLKLIIILCSKASTHKSVVVKLPGGIYLLLVQVHVLKNSILFESNKKPLIAQRLI